MTKEKEDPRLELSVWVKPNKTEIKLNGFDNTIEIAKSLGWEKKGAAKAKTAPAKKPAKKTVTKKAA